MIKKLLLTIGCSGSGKSTFAKTLIESDNSWIEINRDNIRAELFCNGIINNLWKNYNFSKSNEKLVTGKALELFSSAVKNQKQIIISDTNLSVKTRNKWFELSENLLIIN